LLHTSCVGSLYDEDDAAARTDIKSLGPMCVLQARAKAQTAMSHELSELTLAAKKRQLLPKQGESENEPIGCRWFPAVAYGRASIRR
jgi:hypothetical protein